VNKGLFKALLPPAGGGKKRLIPKAIAETTRTLSDIATHGSSAINIIDGGAVMARMKTVSVEAKLDEKFKIDVKAGAHVMVVDQPRAGGGADAGPTPLEYFFASLAGCIGTVARIVANQKRIPLRGIDMKIEGDFDVETLLGKSKENRAGFAGIKVILKIDADMSKAEKESFIHEIESRCPVSDNIACSTPVAIEIV
jgi:uncharacterized OsmC-like protein